MKSALKEQIGALLLPVLEPFHTVDGYPLKSVWETSVGDDLETIYLEFEPGYLTLSVDGEDDSIDITMTSKPGETSRRTSDLLPWKSRIGQNFGWGWLGINQQGYLDGISLSFGSVTPQFCITAVSSSLLITQNHNVIKRQAPGGTSAAQADVVHFAKSA